MVFRGALLVAFTCVTSFLYAGAHSWRVVEVFSNADGTVQFIELQECCGSPNEIGLGSAYVTSTSTGNQFDFNTTLPAGSTANASLLLGTAAFAALPGAPAPDFVIPDNFVDTTADSVEYFVYPAGTLTYTNLPNDGINSVSSDGTTGVNSPTNFAGESGSVDASGSTGGPNDFIRGDANGNGDFEPLPDAVFLLNFGFLAGPAPTCERTADADDSGTVQVLTDVLYLLNASFVSGPAIPEPNTCGQDPTPDALTCDTSGCP